MKMPRIWEIVNKFKDLCRRYGWKTSENEDWVEFDDEYHNFLWARNVSSSSFKSIVSNRKCGIRDGKSYRVVETSYIAWLFPEKPSEMFARTISENPDFSRRVALYDLSPVLEGKKQCIKVNSTDSPVFKEFESFLQKELSVKLKPFFAPELNEHGFPVAELA